MVIVVFQVVIVMLVIVMMSVCVGIGGCDVCQFLAVVVVEIMILVIKVVS
jgi:hypothetical protein